MSTKKVLGGALGECVHIAGLANVLKLAEEHGWETELLGPAVPIERFVAEIRERDPDLVAISYRLTPDTGESLVKRFIAAVRAAGLANRRFVFGGTPPVADKIRPLEFFDQVFSGEEPLSQLVDFFRGTITEVAEETDFVHTFRKRVGAKSPYPLIRHHFGLPTVDATARGIEQISEAAVLDVVSLGTDQDAQENFYHPERQDPTRAGAGGVPVRSEDDFRRLYEASRRGNFPLMRTYSGTDDHIRLAEMYLRTINNAWCATSLFWFNRLDGRGPVELAPSIRGHQELMKWHGQRGVPVEANEPHHWGMRGSSDVTYVVASFLSTYNAKKLGVQDFICQYMFDCPPGLSDKMDLAKMLACIELNEELADDDFRVYRQTRTGLLSQPIDPDMALGQVGASVYLQMALRPHIVHVVSACEAHHAALPEDIIHNTRLAQWVIKTALDGAPDLTADPAVQDRKHTLVLEARQVLGAITQLAGAGVEDPWTDPGTLARAVKIGVLDAPQLKGNPEASGAVETAIADGASVTIDPITRKPLSEAQRLERLLSNAVAAGV